MNKHICKAKCKNNEFWRKNKNGSWVYGYYVPAKDEYGDEVTHAIFSTDCRYRGAAEYDYWEWYEVDPNTVCRYTGKEDKNGTPIFENDICKVDFPYGPFDDNGGYELKTRVAICEFDQFSAEFMCVSEYGDMYRWYGTGVYSDIKDELVEVIGNRFDDTELMEE